MSISGITNPTDYISLAKASVSLETQDGAGIATGDWYFNPVNPFTLSTITYFTVRAEDLTGGASQVRY